MEVIITDIKRTDRIAKASGKPFVSVGIKTSTYGDKWLSGFGGPENEAWIVGSKVEIEVETKGEYLNFKTPKRSGSATGSGTSDGAKNYLEFAVMPILEAMRDDLKALRKAQIGEEKPSFPPFDETSPHDADGFPF